MGRNERLLNVSRRLRTISWALTDQVLFAGSNFLLGLLTARWMTPEEFGALATALVVQTLVISMYEAAFTEPMTVFGVGRFRDQFRPYLGALVVGHTAIAAAACGVLVLIALLIRTLGDSIMAAALIGLGLSTPFVLVRYLARKACYAIYRPRSATFSGVVYAGALFAGIGYVGSTVSLQAVFAFLAVASALSAVATIPALRPSKPDREMLRAVPTAHWTYARWSIATALIKQIPQHAWYFILPIWAGLEGNAILRALSILNLFIGHILAAFFMLLLPALIRVYETDRRRFDSLSIQASFAAGGVGFLYWLAAAMFGEQMIFLMYDGKYVENAPLLTLLCLAPLAWGLGLVGAARAQAAERPDLIFRSAIVGLVATIPGLLLTFFYGITGVVWATVMVSAATSFSQVRLTFGDVSRWPSK